MIDFWQGFGLTWLAGTGLCSIYAFARFLRWHTAYNAGLLVIFVLLLIHTAIDVAAPGKLVSMEMALLAPVVGESGARVVVASVYILLLIFIIAFIYYRDIKRFVAQRRRQRH